MICHAFGFLPFRNVLQLQRLLRWTDKLFREKEREGLLGEGGGRRRGRQDVDEIVSYMTYPFQCKKVGFPPSNLIFFNISFSFWDFFFSTEQIVRVGWPEFRKLRLVRSKKCLDSNEIQVNDMKGCAVRLGPFWSGYITKFIWFIWRGRGTAPCMESSGLQVVTVTTWLFPFVMSCFVLGTTFFWPFLLVRVARPAVARCAGGRVSCWHYRFIEDTFHSAPDHGLDGRPSVLEGKTIWCLHRHRHNQLTQHVNGRTFQNKHLNRTPVYILVIRIESDPKSQNSWVFSYL